MIGAAGRAAVRACAPWVGPRLCVSSSRCEQGGAPWGTAGTVRPSAGGRGGAGRPGRAARGGGAHGYPFTPCALGRRAVRSRASRAETRFGCSAGGACRLPVSSCSGIGLVPSARLPMPAARQARSWQRRAWRWRRNRPGVGSGAQRHGESRRTQGGARKRSQEANSVQACGRTLRESVCVPDANHVPWWEEGHRDRGPRTSGLLQQPPSSRNGCAGP